MSKTLVKNKLGYLTASAVAIFQGNEAILFKLFCFVLISATVDTTSFGAAALGGKEALALFASILIFGHKTVIDLFKKFKTKRFALFSIASIGTAFGNMFYLLAIIIAGPSYGTILTALYPIFSMMLIKIFMKDKDNYKVWIGIAITVIAGLMFSLLPSIFEGKGHFDFDLFFGMALGALAALLWAFEGLFIKKGMDLEEEGTEFSQKEIILTRSSFTTLITFALIMPVSMAFGKTFFHFGHLFEDWKLTMILLAMVVNIVILRYFHVYSIKAIGPKLTAVIDTNNFLIPALFALVAMSLPPGIDGKVVYEQIVWWSWSLVIPIIIGVTMVIYYHEDENTDDILERQVDV